MCSYSNLCLWWLKSDLSHCRYLVHNSATIRAGESDVRQWTNWATSQEGNKTGDSQCNIISWSGCRHLASFIGMPPVLSHCRSLWVLSLSHTTFVALSTCTKIQNRSVLTMRDFAQWWIGFIKARHFKRFHWCWGVGGVGLIRNVKWPPTAMQYHETTGYCTVACILKQTKHK